MSPMPDAERFFRAMPEAPPNPFPLIGGEGEKHADTSRPVDVDVHALVIDNAGA